MYKMKRERRKLSPVAAEYSTKKQDNLYAAVLSRDKVSIRALLKEKKGDNKVGITNGPNKETSLHLACSIGDLKIVKMLLKYMKDFEYSGLDTLDDEGLTALDRAKQKDFSEIVALLQQVKEEPSPMNEVSKKGEKKRGRKKAGVYRPSYNPVTNAYEKQPPCTCCHICRNSISKKNRESVCCSECHYVYCKACLTSKTQYNWEDVKDDASWVCRVCLGTCSCQRCQVRGPPRWYGHKAEKNVQTKLEKESHKPVSQYTQQVSNPVQTSPPTEMPTVSSMTVAPSLPSDSHIDDNPFGYAAEPIFGVLNDILSTSSMCIEDIPSI